MTPHASTMLYEYTSSVTGVFLARSLPWRCSELCRITFGLGKLDAFLVSSFGRSAL